VKSSKNVDAAADEKEVTKKEVMVKVRRVFFLVMEAA